MHEHEHHHHNANASSIPPERQAVCPVTGDAVDKQEAQDSGRVREHNGETYYFCCNTCVQLFDKNPDKYTHQHQETATLKLQEKENLVGNVWAFRFKPNKPLAWTPGQFIRVELPHENPDDEGTKRWFTISSTPHDGFVQITTRITGTSFKQALTALPIDGILQLVEQPDGDFVWQDDELPLIFVAGGIGITPYYSILKARGHSGQPVTATLIYNGRDENLPFRNEFEEAAKRHTELHLQYVIGEQLNTQKLTELVPDLMLHQVYISGPEPMVEALGEDLRAAGLPESNLHQDFFPNYDEANF